LRSLWKRGEGEEDSRSTGVWGTRLIEKKEEEKRKTSYEKTGEVNLKE